jgi:hypothetical protein
MGMTEEEMALDLEVMFIGAPYEGSMPVNDLAPSLLALGNFLGLARTVVAPDGPPINLEIKATREGSFEITLHVGAVVERLIQFMSGVGPAATANTITVVSAALKFFIWKAGRRVLRVTPGPTPETQTIHVEGDNNTINQYNIEKVTLQFVEQPGAQKLANDFVRPLQREGAEAIVVRRPVNPSDDVTIRKQDLDGFERGAAEESLVVDDRTFDDTVVSIVSASFDPKYIWRLDWGDQRINAHMRDHNFLAELNRGQDGFFQGDSMRVDLHRRQWAAIAAKPVEWTVERVYEHQHIGAAIQALPFEEESDDDA